MIRDTVLQILQGELGLDELLEKSVQVLTKDVGGGVDRIGNSFGWQGALEATEVPQCFVDVCHPPVCAPSSRKRLGEVLCACNAMHDVRNGRHFHVENVPH